MTAARLTAAEAKALGLKAPTTAPGRSRPRNRSTAKTPYRTRCATCHEMFDRPVDEDRHFDANPEHRRYEVRP